MGIRSFELSAGLERPAPVRKLVQKVSGGLLLADGLTAATPYSAPFGSTGNESVARLFRDR